MRKGIVSLLLATAACLLAANAQAIGKTGFTAYGTYWNGDDSGYGYGVKATKSLLDILFADARIGYLNFNDSDTEVIPLEASINVGLPGVITPYAGVGAGYYFIDGPMGNNAAGYFGQIGVEISIAMFGVLAEVRYHDLAENAFDGPSASLGILLKF
ncbi:hypothetical protein [Pontiella sp.]|uniref:hypothetical protein n=1 Tax=Pontiella sp. TaxID=2837462 RepID=UPI003562C214